jgi:hypothetical protein
MDRRRRGEIGGSGAGIKRSSGTIRTGQQPADERSGVRTLSVRSGFDYAAEVVPSPAGPPMPPAPLPSAGEQDVPACLAVLGLRPPLTMEDVKQAYLAKAVTAHPDRGGSPEQFIRLQKAFEEANEYVKFKASKLEWLASKVEAYAEQQEIASAAIERGGAIEMEETDWLRKSFGEDFGHVADKLVAVRLRGPQADDVFAILLGFRAESLKDLALLDLAGGTITDEGLLQLKGLKGLRHLDLRGTAVGRLAADVPQWFEHLEYLGLPKGAVGLFGRLGMPRRVTLELGDAPAS